MPNSLLDIITTIAPFALFALLWFVLLKRMQRGKGGQSWAESVRAAVREEVAPEIRALR